MKTKFPFKYNKVAAVLMLAPIGLANAAAPYFSENATIRNHLDYLYSPSEVADSTYLNLSINPLNNEYITSHQTGTNITAITSVEGTETPVVTEAINKTASIDGSNQRVIVNPYDNSLILAYTTANAISFQKSTDNGVTWVDQASIATTAAGVLTFDVVINDQGQAFVFFLDISTAPWGSGNFYSYDFASDTPAATWTQETFLADGEIKSAAYGYDVDPAWAMTLNSEGLPTLAMRNNNSNGDYAATHNYLSVISRDALGTWTPKSTGAVRDLSFHFRYLDAAYNNNDELYVFASRNAQSKVRVFKLTDHDSDAATDPQLVQVGNDVAVNPDATNNTYTRLKIAFDSKDVPYIAYQQTDATKSPVEVKRYDEDLADWVEVTYDSESTDINSGSSTTAVHDSFDLAIDNRDLPVLYVKTGGDGNDGFAKVLRASYSAPGTDSLDYSVTEGNLVVGTLSGRDPDGDAITFSITDAGNGDALLFSVDAENDQLNFIAPAVPKESNEPYNFTVTATANGESTSVDVVVAIIKDRDLDGVADEVDVFPDDPTEWLDSDEDGYGDNADPTPDNPEDVTGPTIGFINVNEDGEGPTLVFNATGLTSEIPSSVIADFIAANVGSTDFREGDSTVGIAEGANTQLVAGVNTIELSSFDSLGNEDLGTVNLGNGIKVPFVITVYVNPVVQVATNILVETDSTLTVPVSLQGLAPAYPVVLNYTVTPSNTGITSEALTASFEEGDVLEINYDLSSLPEEERLQAGESLSIELIDATNASVLDETVASAEVVTGNFAPIVTMSLSQQNAEGTFDNVAFISNGAGLVKVTANVTDINANDTHCFTFTPTDSEFTEYVEPIEVVDPEAESEVVTNDDCNLSNTFVFDTSHLDQVNAYSLEVNVVENHSNAPFTVDQSIDFRIVTADVTLMDSNENGIPDFEESESAINDSTILNIVPEGEYLQVPAGLKLSLGDIAAQDLASDTGFRAAIAEDAIDSDLHFTRLSEIINFNVDGLQQAGDSVSVVMPLADGVVIPELAVYRKYTDQNGDWFDFVVDENNQIASALKDAAGNCPVPQSMDYVEGLIEGNDCIQLTIEDGGLNDGDSMANGTVVDPGVLAIELENNAPEIISLGEHSASAGVEFTVHAVVSDAEEDAISYTWTQLDTDAALTAEIVDANAREGVFIAPDVAAGTELTFSLTINDGYVDSEPKEFTVKVETVNLKPEHEVDRKSGSFGWIMGLFTLAGLVARRKSKRS